MSRRHFSCFADCTGHLPSQNMDLRGAFEKICTPTPAGAGGEINSGLQWRDPLGDPNTSHTSSGGRSIALLISLLRSRPPHGSETPSVAMGLLSFANPYLARSVTLPLLFAVSFAVSSLLSLSRRRGLSDLSCSCSCERVPPTHRKLSIHGAAGNCLGAGGGWVRESERDGLAPQCSGRWVCYYRGCLHHGFLSALGAEEEEETHRKSSRRRRACHRTVQGGRREARWRCFPSVRCCSVRPRDDRDRRREESAKDFGEDCSERREAGH